MNKPIYRQVIKDAWQLAWKNKFLWLFGFFAGILINGGVYDLGVRMFGRVSHVGYSWDALVRGFFQPDLFINLSRLGWQIPEMPILNSVWTVVVLIVSLAVILFFVWLSVVSQGALIAGVDNTYKKKKNPEKNSFIQGLEYFWPLLSINVFLKISVFLLVIFTSFPLVLLLGESITLNALLYLLAFLIFIPLSIIIYFLALLASCYIVLRKKKLRESIHLAWELFKRNWMICLELGFLLFVIAFMVGLLIVLIFLVLAVPIVLLFLAAAALGSTTALMVVAVLGFMVFALVTILGAAFVVTFQYTSWVLLFERLTKKGGISRLVRWVAGISKLHEGKKPVKKRRATKKRVIKRKK
jgi:hypothetical protein